MLENLVIPDEENPLLRRLPTGQFAFIDDSDREVSAARYFSAELNFGRMSDAKVIMSVNNLRRRTVDFFTGKAQSSSLIEFMASLVKRQDSFTEMLLQESPYAAAEFIGASNRVSLKVCNLVLDALDRIVPDVIEERFRYELYASRKGYRAAMAPLSLISAYGSIRTKRSFHALTELLKKDMEISIRGQEVHPNTTFNNYPIGYAMMGEFATPLVLTALKKLYKKYVLDSPDYSRFSMEFIVPACVWVDTLGRLHHHAAISLLREMFDSGLGKDYTPRLVTESGGESFFAHALDHEYVLRMSIISALGRIDSPHVIPILERISNQQFPRYKGEHLEWQLDKTPPYPSHDLIKRTEIDFGEDLREMARMGLKK
jgi:hypothetical protein